MIPYGRQEITQQDIDAVTAVLQSDFLTQGPVVPQFEKAIGTRVDAQHALAVNSATSALHIACLALELGPDDWLWTTPITFVASANCGRYCGANIDFVDIDPKTYNLCTETLAHKLAQAKLEGRLPKVLVAVHLSGQPCDMAAISRLAQEYGFKVIEDASHAIGGSYEGAPIGNCRHSDITVFSFHPVKIITTAEGGVAVTNSPDLAAKMDLFRSHGVTRDPHLMTKAPDGPWYYQQVELGFNYRMTELQAALGLSQLDRLDSYVERRHLLARRYDDLLADLPVTIPWQSPNQHSGLHLYVIRLKLNDIASSHRDVFEQLRNKGIGVNLHYIPLYQHPYYAGETYGNGPFPESEHYYTEAISLPMYPLMTLDQQDYVVDCLREAVNS